MIGDLKEVGLVKESLSSQNKSATSQDKLLHMLKLTHIATVSLATITTLIVFIK